MPHPLPSNAAISRSLRELGLYLEMDGIPFKPQALERAAAWVAASPRPLAELYRDEGLKALEALPGIGTGIANRVAALVDTGHIDDLEAFRTRWPVDVLALTSLEGVGPKTVRALHEQLGVHTVEDLRRAAQEGRTRGVARFGAKREARLLAAFQAGEEAVGRHLLGEVLPVAARLVLPLRAVPGVRAAEVAGSVRRFRETIGDIDVVVASTAAARAIRTLCEGPGVMRVLARGSTRASVSLDVGLNVDLRVVSPACFGAALLYFTGSKDHNVALRRRAQQRGLKLSEYGLFRGKRRIAGKTEQEVFSALGLQWIPPELREAEGELELAEAHALPELLRPGDLRGDLQLHTLWTDGAATPRQMAEAARARGREYVVITDHARDLAFLGGLDETRLAREVAQLRALDAELHGIRVLAGAEVNIRQDGTLDLSDEALASLDFCGAAVHSHFDLPRAETTARLVRAVRHPGVDVLFHPTARSIGRRRGLDADWEAVFAACREAGTAVELDARPDRLDLPPPLLRAAVKAGLGIVVDSDAHGPGELAFLDDLGVGVARRGWVPRASVWNALALRDFRKKLKREPGVLGPTFRQG